MILSRTFNNTSSGIVGDNNIGSVVVADIHRRLAPSSSVIVRNCFGRATESSKKTLRCRRNLNLCAFNLIDKGAFLDKLLLSPAVMALARSLAPRTSGQR